MKTTHTMDEVWRCLSISGIGGNAQKGLQVLSYLFIVKYLEERSIVRGAADTTFAGQEAENCHWQMIKEMARQDEKQCATHLRENVSRWLRLLHPDSCLSDADVAFAQLLPQAMYRVMDAVDTLCEGETSLSEVFEAVIVSAGEEGAYFPRAGQILTPMHIAQLMADLVRPQPGEAIIDPSCGTANLLVAAWLHLQANQLSWPRLQADGRILRETQEQPLAFASLQGADFDAYMQPSAYAHLLLAGVDLPQLRETDALGSHFAQRMAHGELGQADVVLANPPFSGALDGSDLSDSLRWLNTQRTELLFVDLCRQLLRQGGRAALLLPEGTLRNTSPAAVAVRKKLLTENQVQAIISLPQGVFQPHTGVKTSLVLFTKGGLTERVWCYRCLQDGYSLDARRKAAPSATDLWDIRLQHAAVFGLTPPVPVPGLCAADVWEHYASDPAYAATQHAFPEITTQEEGVQVVTALTTRQVEEQQSRYLSFEEIEERGYSLSLDTYQEDDPSSRRARPGRRVLPPRREAR